MSCLAVDQSKNTFKSSNRSGWVISHTSPVHTIGEDSAALTDYTALLELEPQNTDALYHRGAVLQRQACIDEAIADYSAVLRLDPHHAKALLARATCWNVKGHWQQAIGKKTRHHTSATLTVATATRIPPQLSMKHAPVGTSWLRSTWRITLTYLTFHIFSSPLLRGVQHSPGVRQAGV